MNETPESKAWRRDVRHEALSAIRNYLSVEISEDDVPYSPQGERRLTVRLILESPSTGDTETISSDYITITRED